MGFHVGIYLENVARELIGVTILLDVDLHSSVKLPKVFFHSLSNFFMSLISSINSIITAQIHSIKGLKLKKKSFLFAYVVYKTFSLPYHEIAPPNRRFPAYAMFIHKSHDNYYYLHFSAAKQIKEWLSPLSYVLQLSYKKIGH